MISSPKISAPLRAWFALQPQKRRRRGHAGDTVPLTVPGLKLWLRAETLGPSLGEGAAVATWPDESGNGKHLVQTNPDRRPVMQLDDSIWSVCFDGANNVLATASNVLNTDRHTIFLVARPLSTQTNDAVGTGGTGSGDLLWMLVDNRARGHIWRGAPSNTTDGATLIHNGNFLLIEQEVTATQIILRLNGVVDASPALTGAAAGASKPIYLGSRNSSWFFQGLVQALLVYEGNPSTEEKARIREYLISIYAIPIPYPPPPIPGQPLNLSGEAGDGGDVNLYWDMWNSLYTEGVKVERKLASEPDAAFVEIGDAGEGSVDFYDGGQGPDAVVYRVRAYNASGYSAYSNTVTVEF